MAKNRRDKKNKPQYTSARESARKRKTGFESTSITVPEGVDVFRFEKKGRYNLDIMPFVALEGNPGSDPGKLTFDRIFYTHRDIGANPKNHYVCPKKTFGKPCPVCEYIEEIEDDADSGSEDLAKKLRPKKRQLFNVIDTNDRDKGVQLLEISYHNFGAVLDDTMDDLDQLDELSEKEERMEAFFLLEDGLTLELRVKEERIGSNTFLAVNRIDFKEREEDYDESIMEDVICLDEVPKELSYDKLKSILHQEPRDEDDEDEDDTEEEPHTKKKKPPKDEDDDFDDDEDDSDEEDDDDFDEDEDESDDDDSDFDDSDEWTDDDNDEDEDSEDSEDDEDDEELAPWDEELEDFEEEEEPPKKKPKKKKGAKKKGKESKKKSKKKGGSGSKKKKSKGKKKKKSK